MTTMQATDGRRRGRWQTRGGTRAHARVRARPATSSRLPPHPRHAVDEDGGRRRWTPTTILPRVAERVAASTPRERPSRQVFLSVRAALHQVWTLLRCHLNPGEPARPMLPPSSCAASQRCPTLSAMFSRQSRTGPATPRLPPGPQIRPTYIDTDCALSTLTDSTACTSSGGLRGSGAPPYDAWLCTHTAGYCVARHNLRMKLLAAGAAPPFAVAAAAKKARRRSAMARLERDIIGVSEEDDGAMDGRDRVARNEENSCFDGVF
ncbi:uncharacterized protein [Oryza sativa Japonica Group]|uniref:uncharacterized protein n=1 Tax=Oryza sativa subsp. japonica TaxID=39947 RepID=UPI000E1B989D|nr:uncharacterized protein LOC107282078 isoform X1 [Oryza sativa Japonica Group]XP_025875651.1 uncharacterized protein LOC107282078 isoform X1 [Oryza sativa Japonica Group]XP_025875652.1 uncharacterized protein LOC107282078 isoform X1 [Oryza sativa Japonica Group]XP_025875653.1 uncharacterized protein LOC107282078 isoform X1 [Oryza sativa Japonica Group]XP_025875654.1 uncharacterized protein LOC107282078 isoform X1 [Oryza sativa Japonica Group]XP_025875655.1 uncharacterized protein LOC10728207